MSVTVSDVRSQIRDLPRNVGVQPESPRVIGNGDGTTTTFYLPVGKYQYYGSLVVYVNGVAISSAQYGISPSGIITFLAAPANGSVISATYQVTAWTDAELLTVLNNALAVYGGMDDRTIRKACTVDLIDQMLANTDLLSSIREDTYSKDPAAVIAALSKLKDQLNKELQAGPRPGQAVPFLSVGSVPGLPYTPKR